MIRWASKISFPLVAAMCAWSYHVPVPAGSKGPVEVTACLRYRRFSQEVADQYLGKPGCAVPVVNVASGETRARRTGP